MNAVISSAPPDYMRMITNVITQLDKPNQEVTLMRLFHLTHADPGEVSDELDHRFPFVHRNHRSEPAPLGMRFMPPWMQQQTPPDDQSQRMKLQTTVLIQPDRRTQSVIVTASKDMMEQIEGVIKDLDEGSKVFKLSPPCLLAARTRPRCNRH